MGGMRWLGDRHWGGYVLWGALYCVRLVNRRPVPLKQIIHYMLIIKTIIKKIKKNLKILKAKARRFLAGTLQATEEWHDRKNPQPRILCPARLSFRI